MDTLLYDVSIPAISSLQTSLAGQANFMQLMSTVFDPKYAFLIYSPLAYLLDPKVGRKLIMTTVLAEWLNQVLKWFMHGERPYWYVHSSGHFNPRDTPIKQFPITCELGPGHPSGHAMVTSAVWYVILSSLLQAYNNHHQQQQAQLSSSSSSSTSSSSCTQATEQHDKSSPSLTAKLITWSAYVTLLAIVSVSRVFLGCHFPHQCLAGAALGLVVSRWVCHRQIKPIHYVSTSLLLFVTAFGTYALLEALGLDPSWTIRLATKHCVKRDYIHLDTAPFFSIMRYCGFALGCGLGLMYPVRERALAAFSQLVPVQADESVVECETASRKLSSSRAITWLSFKLVMALIMARLVDNLGLFVSHSNLTLFYSAAFCAYTLFSYAFTNL